MLPASHRMRRSEEFSATVRGGTKGRAQRVVVHLTTHEGSDAPTLVGFVVPKSVGVAVCRNQVKRRLRAAMTQQLAALGPGRQVVVRALPASAGADFHALSADLDTALRGALRPRRPGRRGGKAA